MKITILNITKDLVRCKKKRTQSRQPSTFQHTLGANKNDKQIFRTESSSQNLYIWYVGRYPSLARSILIASFPIGLFYSCLKAISTLVKTN